MAALIVALAVVWYLGVLAATLALCRMAALSDEDLLT